MKRISTFVKGASKRAFALGLVCLAAASTALAGSQKYADFFGVVEAYPTGAGKVYAEAPTTATVETEDEMSDMYTNMGTPAESIDVKFMDYLYSTNTYANFYAVPNDGWIVAGFSKAKEVVDDDGEVTFVFSDSLYSSDNPAYTYMEAAFSNEDETTAKASFPLSPSCKYYAIFTHVKPAVAHGLDSLGTVSISKVCNNIGDNVLLTATPSEYRHATFTHWINKTTGEKFTDNPLEVSNIQDTAVYEAYFTSDSLVYVQFPEEGGYLLFDNAGQGYTMPNDGCYDLTWYDYGVNNPLNLGKDSVSIYCSPSTLYKYCYQGAHIIYGKGTQPFIKDGSVFEASSSQIGYSGKDGLSLDTLARYKFYTINTEKEQFELVTSETIAPETYYYYVSADWFANLNLIDIPSVIYWYDPSETAGVETIKAANTVKAAKKGIYTLDGKAVKTPSKGLYIIDGKKVVKLK